jgi:hypothetical protein
MKKVKIAVFCLLLSCPFVFAQETKIRSMGGRLILEGPGVWRDLGNGEQKQYISLSPDGSKVIYHDGFKQNRSPSLTLTVLDAQTGHVVRKIPLDIASKFLIFVDWLDNRHVVVQTSNEYTVVDIESGRIIHRLSCDPPGLAALSPDRRLIVFQMSGGGHGIPPEYASDYIRLALVEKGPPQGKTYDYSLYMGVYPEVVSGEKLEFKRYDDLDERHQIMSGLVWARDGRKIAFVEEQRRKFWLVVLTVVVEGETVTATHKRIELVGLAEEGKDLLLGPDVRSVEWMPDGRTIKVASHKSAWLADLEAGVARLISGEQNM